MTYELAKQLYKKGSPFTSPVPVTEANMKYIDFPTLEELIEACGDKVDYLKRYKADGIWEAGYLTYESEGSTPSEAVANL